MNNLKPSISFENFTKVDVRIGTIIEVNDFPKAHKPAFQLTIDFGELGIKKSSAQITKLYSKDQLIGKQITAIVNFEAKQIANFRSQCLILGVQQGDEVTLLQTSKQPIKNGEQVS